jgi:hypothetical protein
VWTFSSHTQEIRPALVIFSLAKKTHKCLPPSLFYTIPSESNRWWYAQDNIRWI